MVNYIVTNDGRISNAYMILKINVLLLKANVCT